MAIFFRCAAPVALAALLIPLCVSSGLGIAGDAEEGTAPAAEAESRRRMLFVFGDSYADTGNLGNLGRWLTRSWYYPYGVTFPGWPTGRFSDGRLLTDFVASSVGVPSPPTYKRRRSASLGVLARGMNFAVAGSGVLDTGNLQRNLSAQIDLLASEIAATDGLFSQQSIASGAVALVSVSGNDYWFAATMANSTEAALKYIPAVLRQLRVDLRRLGVLGFKKVMVTNLHALGCAPFFTKHLNYTTCDDFANNGAMEHNRGLYALLSELNQLFPNNRTFIALDLYSSFYSIADPGGTAASKFTSPRRPCCQGFAAGRSCGEVDDGVSKQYTLCADHGDYFYWDDVHPTQAGWAAVMAALKPAIARFLSYSE